MTSSPTGGTRLIFIYFFWWGIERNVWSEVDFRVPPSVTEAPYRAVGGACGAEPAKRVAAHQEETARD